jgi:glutamyl/glutaminyl-tRNA synthetase
MRSAGSAYPASCKPKEDETGQQRNGPADCHHRQRYQEEHDAAEQMQAAMARVPLVPGSAGNVL